MIKYIKGDITKATRGVIAHGVNCQHVMNAGVARAIREKWPKVYQQYMSRPKGATMLGTADAVHLNEQLIIINCYTQLFYGRDGGKYADDRAVKQSLLRAGQIANLHKLPLIMPRIGCGLGGLSWHYCVRDIVEEVANTFDRIDIYICDLSQEVSNESNLIRS